MNVVAVSGSLRAASINTAFCRAAARLATPPMQVAVFDGLGALPLFNPDLEVCPPQAVLRWREAVGGAQALLIASPEYAHGIPGPMKNALDWLVSFEGFIGKPVALVNTSPRASHAQQALGEVLRTMSARLVPGAALALPLLGGCTTEATMLASGEICARIRGLLDALRQDASMPDRAGPSFPLDG